MYINMFRHYLAINIVIRDIVHQQGSPLKILLVILYTRSYLFTIRYSIGDWLSHMISHMTDDKVTW